jgi:hypothetical protein
MDLSDKPSGSDALETHTFLRKDISFRAHTRSYNALCQPEVHSGSS